jgi:hypothetical protein
VDQSVRLEAGDQEGVQRLIQYFLRCPFSQARMIQVTEAGKVIYKTEHNAVGRFPEPGDEELLAGPSRNFQVFDPLDFLAEVTQHICLPAGRSPIRAATWYATTDGLPAAVPLAQAGTRTSRAVSGRNGNRRRAPEWGFPPAPPRRVARRRRPSRSRAEAQVETQWGEWWRRAGGGAAARR